ncbi:MAG: bacillithiol system redox-active protein YtxJ [Pyrinomonadaceae bacterium]
MMINHFIEINDLESLDGFVANLNGSAGVVFKHSDTCGVSSRAYGELSKLTFPVGIVVVQRAQSVSAEIERRWRVDHETPQVLIIKDSEVVWNASHFQVKAAEVEAAAKQVSGEQSPAAQ